MKKILNRLLSRMVITCFLVVVQLAIMILGACFSSGQIHLYIGCSQAAQRNSCNVSYNKGY